MTDRRFKQARGVSNGCSGCRQDFTSIRLFDAHRTGKHAHDWSEAKPDGRRCLDVEEMEALGWKRNDFGRWFDPVALAKAQKGLSALQHRVQNDRERRAA